MTTRQTDPTHARARARIALPDLAVVQFQGTDALAFLQGQLSNDVLSMPPTEARLAAWCSAKGRVLATLVVWRAPSEAGDVCYALVAADVADALVKRLSLFVLRAKVTIRVVARRVAGEIAPAAQDGNAPPWTVSNDGQDTCIQAPSADPAQRRAWRIGPVLDGDVDGDVDGAQAWRAADVAAGLPWIGAANQDLYIAQTLNLDLLGAISFTKGCFPGQEVVARSHYRGTLKRRMAYGVVAAHAQATIGMDVFKAGRPDAPCGRVINLADQRSTGLRHLLLEVQLADLPDADFRLGAADGAAVTLRALPYAIAQPASTFATARAALRASSPSSSDPAGTA